VASAQAKLERIMPANLKHRVRAVDETVKLDLARATAPGDNAALVALSAAAQTQRRVHLHYRAAQRSESERDFDPYGLVYRGGCWYAVGMCHLRQGLRSFRLDRIQQVQQLEARFKRPPDFDALAHLAFSVATLPRAYTIEVLLKADLKTARAHIADSIGVFEQVTGGVLIRNQSDDLDWFARQLARLPFAFEIRSPHELRAALKDCAQRLMKLADG